MAFSNPENIYSFEANGDLSADQFLFFKIDSNGQLDRCDTQGEQAFGVLQDAPAAAGRAGALATSGIVKVVANAALAIGTNVTPATTGKAEAALTGDYIAGEVVANASAADGDVISVLLSKPGRVA